MKEHLDKVKFAASKALTRLVIKALDDARLQIEAQTMRFAGAKPPPIAEESGGIAERFMNSIHSYFEELTTLVVKDPEIEPDSYDHLSLVDHDYLEAMIAMGTRAAAAVLLAAGLRGCTQAGGGARWVPTVMDVEAVRLSRQHATMQ